MGALGMKSYEEWKTDADKIIGEHGVKNEQVAGFSLAQERPTMWWSLLLGIFYAFIVKNDLIVLTNKKLHIIKLDMMNKPASLESYDFGQVKGVEYKKNILSDHIVMEFPDGKKRKFNFPKLLIKTFKEFPEQLASELKLNKK